MNEEHEYDYTMHMSIEDVRLMHYCVQKAIEYWPGAPARPYEEQEQQIWALPLEADLLIQFLVLLGQLAFLESLLICWLQYG